MTLRFLFFLVLIFSLIGTSISQNIELSGFGLRFKPIISNDFFSKQSQSGNAGSSSMNFTKKTSLLFGAVVRGKLYKKIRYQLGINAIRHSQEYTLLNLKSNTFSKFNLHPVSFEIPLELGYRLKLGNRVDMTGYAGISLETSLYSIKQQDFRAGILVDKNAAVNLAVLGEIGWVYKTFSNGGIYLGISIHNALFDTYRSFIEYVYDSGEIDQLFFDIQIDYFSLDMVYFFP